MKPIDPEGTTSIEMLGCLFDLYVVPICMVSTGMRQKVCASSGSMTSTSGSSLQSRLIGFQFQMGSHVRLGTTKSLVSQDMLCSDGLGHWIYIR